MAMKVKNNLSAMRSLGQININITELGKALAKVSSGQKINSAGDDASGMAISERMRVRIRALEQDIQNVKNGRAMLDTAEGGIQRQLDLMRTIKAKVIDAANDSNTDDDRLTIQKEIDHYFKEIQSIAYDTDFNGIKLLIGNEPLRKIAVEYELLDTPVFVAGSDALNLINGTEPNLDGRDGSFNRFTGYNDSVKVTIDPLLGSKTSDIFRGGADGTPAHWNFDFDSFTSAADVIGHGFTIEANVDADGKELKGVNAPKSTYVFYDPKVWSPMFYNTSGYEKDLTFIAIDSSASNWRQQAATGLADAVNANTNQNSYITSDAPVGNSVTVKSTYNQKEDSAADVLSQVKTDSGYTTEIHGASATGLNLPQFMSGGKEKVVDKQYSAGYIDSSDRYHSPVEIGSTTVAPGERAKVEVDVSNVAADTGFEVTGKDGKVRFVKFVADGERVTTTDSGQVYLVPLNKSPVGILMDNGIELELKNGTLTLTAVTSTDSDPDNGENTEPNGTWGITSDGIPNSPSVYVRGIEPLTLPAKVDGTDGPPATYDINLTRYDTTNAQDLDDFIDALTGKAIEFPSGTYEFIDSTNSDRLDSKRKIHGSILVDMKNLRTAVQNGKTIADAFSDMMTQLSSSFSTDTSGGQKILRATSTLKGTAGNFATVKTKQGTLEQYPIDFGKWLTDNAANITEPLDKYLSGKGFRFYCATCDDQWFNIQFSADGDDEDAPVDGFSLTDSHLYIVDVASLANADLSTQTGIEDAARTLTKLICDTGNRKISHNYKFAIDDGANVDNAKLIIYDERGEQLTNPPYPNLVPSGHAKITDGIVDDVLKIEKEVPVNEKRLVIQDTDKDSQQIILRLPQTSLNHIFQVKFDEVFDPSRYNVLTKRNRNYLLGWQAQGADAGTHKADIYMGALDKGISYLLDAITLVGAQGARLEMTESNINTQLENETNSESTIRDADMAREMTAYTKANVLSQAAQAMLAQANQNSSAVLSLLQ